MSSGSGDVTANGDVIVNGGDLYATSGSSVNLFNTSQTTTLSIGGNATTLNFGASSATENIHGTTIDFADATGINGTAQRLLSILFK